MINQQKLKIILFYLTGIFLLSLGVTLTLLSNLGAGGWDALTENLSKVTGINIGTILMIIGGVLVLIAAIIKKEKPNYMAFIVSFIIGKFIDFWYYYVFGNSHFTSLSSRLFLVALGVLIIGIGCSMIFVTNLPKNHTETFIFATMDVTKKSYKLIKTIIDSLALVIAILIGYKLNFYKNIGIGTILNTFFMGILIHMLLPYISNFYNRMVKG